MLFAFILLAAPIVPAGQSFDCTPVRVWDGDGPIWCAERPRIRLSGIAAREMDGTCSPGHPCPKVSGTAARDYLVRLVGKPTGVSSQGHILITGAKLSCKSVGGAGGSRTAAWCSNSKSGDLSCAMVKGGYALRWKKYWGRHQCKKP